jgi:hypothetical protein
MIYRLLLAFLALSVTTVTAADANPKDDKLREILENLRSNELLYKDLELIVSRDYKLVNPPVDIPDLVKTGQRKSRFVYQGSMYYLRNDEKITNSRGEDQRPDTLQGFDGEIARVVEQNAIANIRKGRPVDGRLITPHWLLFRGTGDINFPLSSYLRGGESTRARDQFKNATNESAYIGDEMVDGLLCHKIRVAYWLDSWKDRSIEGADLRYIWLAPDRNYLPVKTEMYAHPRREGFGPLDAATSGEFREISPGIWFPFYSEIIVYNLMQAKKFQPALISNMEEIRLEKAELDPQYPKSFFQDIPIPSGMLVYEIEGNKIVRKFYQGGMRKPAPSD